VESVEEDIVETRYTIIKKVSTRLQRKVHGNEAREGDAGGMRHVSGGPREVSWEGF